MNTYDIVVSLTEEDRPAPERRRLLKQFADATGWVPSDELEEYAGTIAVANGHLLVEHGLANTAVISFLKPRTRYRALVLDDRIRLLEISYNNLVPWHLFPDREGLTVVYNLTDPPRDSYFERSSTFDAWCAQAFDRITERRPNPNVKALDDALIANIRHWKLCLATDLRGHVTNDELSALFNTVLLLRLGRLSTSATSYG